MSILKVGDPAPDFEALDCQRQPVRLSSLRGKKVVLFFFPRAFTAACTEEVRHFRDNYDALLSKGAELIGVSVDKFKKQCDFAKAEGVDFTLLSDETRAISEAYGVVWPGIRIDKRVTFVIDAQGVIERVIHDEINVHMHLDAVLEKLGVRPS